MDKDKNDTLFIVGVILILIMAAVGTALIGYYLNKWWTYIFTALFGISSIVLSVALYTNIKNK